MLSLNVSWLSHCRDICANCGGTPWSAADAPVGLSHRPTNSAEFPMLGKLNDTVLLLAWRARLADAGCYPRPINGMPVAITVRNCTLASSGRFAMYRHRSGHVPDVHSRLCRRGAVGLQDSRRHALGHLRGGIADVDLSAGNVVAPAIQ